MIFDFDALSKEFKIFYDAFSPETYGISMGRSAEYAAIEFDNLSNEEKSLIDEWFLELFEEEKDYYGIPYLWVIEKLKDVRFIPLIKNYYKRLKKRHKKIVETYIDGKTIRARSNFTSELVLCKKVIKALKSKKGKICRGSNTEAKILKGHRICAPFPEKDLVARQGLFQLYSPYGE